MIPRVTSELGTVSTLDDRPNDTGGLTAAELKAKFDADAGTLKEYVNDVLIPFLEGTSAAESLGIATISGFSADNIQTALEQIIGAMQDITQGSVADGSITLAKLAAEVTAIALGGAAASHTHGAGDIASGTLESSRIPVLDASKLDAGSVGSSQLASSAVTTQKIKDAAVTADKIASLAVTAQKIAPGAVTAEKIAKGAITPENIGAFPLTGGNVTGPIWVKRETDSFVCAQNTTNNFRCSLDAWDNNVGLYAGHLGKWLINHDGTNLNIDGQQYRHIYAGTAAPSGGSDGDVYIRYS